MKLYFKLYRKTNPTVIKYVGVKNKTLKNKNTYTYDNIFVIKEKLHQQQIQQYQQILMELYV